MVKKKLSALDRLPICFVLCIVATQYILFVAFWCIPGLQLEVEETARDTVLHRKSLMGSAFFHFVLLMFIISFYRTIVTDPGRIPDTPEWRTSPDPLKLHERDLNGQLRFCKFEKKYKPDRAHYCNQLGRNILRMDHYCPWVANGIGFRNYKFFFLSLFYGLICISTTTWFMALTFLHQWNNPQVPWGILYFNFLGAFLGAYMILILFPFFVFHCYLTAKNRTTIEACELAGKSSSIINYDLGNVLYNFSIVMGINPHYWLWPVGKPIGDGLSFYTYESFALSSK